MADRSFVAANDEARDHLRSLMATLTDADMARSAGDGWTVAAVLAHLTFWDQLWMQKFREWERTGTVRIPFAPWHTEDGPPVDVNVLNDAMLPWWRARGLPEVRHDVVAAADAADAAVAALSDPVLEQVAAMRPRTAIRGTHRQEHLAQIERALDASR